MTRPARCVAVLALLLAPSASRAQVFHVEEMTTAQIGALDKQKTAVLLWGGILEEHGPYLPSFTDGYMNEHIVGSLAQAIAARPGWVVLVFPPVPLGAATAEGIGGLRQFPGSYGVRESTLQSVFVDLASAIGEQGFRWVFVVHGHGAPSHNRALDAAAGYFTRHYAGRMVHLTGLADVHGKCVEVIERSLRPAAHKEDARSMHAGAYETSVLLSLREDLVDPAYREARPLPAPGWEASAQVAHTPGWPGYFGSPRAATRALGDECLEVMTAEYNSMALRVLDGFDDSSLPRYAASWGFVWTQGFVWLIAALTGVWLCAVAYASATIPRWLRGFDRARSPLRRALKLLPTVAALALAVTMVAVVRKVLPFSVTALMSLPPDPTYAIVLLSIATIVIAVIKLVWAGGRAFSRSARTVEAPDTQ